ncbi:MAG TPA: fibronectin type III domain-containing protein, partial [Thermoanaerobaculia bacterium]|nr:fibronectin type III domain-containing protein [Thermoanaerobaculia bacterium]
FTTFDAYENARAQTAALVAQTMRPDYFVLQEEPDTESAQSGQSSAGTVSGSTDMLNRTVAAVRGANIAGMKIGAGFGSWLQAYQLFANSFTRQHCGSTQPCLSQSLDFLDMHLFPITEQTVDCSPPPSPKACSAPNFWQNAMAIVSTANAAAMPLTISQTWLRKVRDAEWLQINGDIQEAREAYDFWEPLDLSFLRAVVALANYARMLFVAPFNTQSDSGYLTWSASTALQGEGGSNTPAQVFAAVQSLGLSNAAAARYTSVATGFHDLIVSDTVAPSNPMNIAVTRGTTTATVSWTASTDNVGVAGYHIFRNGVAIADVFTSPFQDSGLTPSAAYSYAVQAFDLGGNVSAAAVRRRAAKH